MLLTLVKLGYSNAPVFPNIGKIVAATPSNPHSRRSGTSSLRRIPMPWKRRLLAILAPALPLVAAACATPVGAVRVDPQVLRRELTGSVLTTGELSRATKNALFVHGLNHNFEDEPEAALGRLRDDILAGRGGQDLMPAAAELSFLHAEGDGPIEMGDDGVVQYQSAHVDGVKSELVVRWEHSVQGQPEAIQEVRRILLLNDGAR